MSAVVEDVKVPESPSVRLPFAVVQLTAFFTADGVPNCMLTTRISLVIAGFEIVAGLVVMFA